MAAREFKLELALAACFVAVQVGALAVCIGIMIANRGPLASLLGINMWVTAQPIIFPIAFLFAPIGALVRPTLGFQRSRSVAITVGILIGLVCSGLIAYSTTADWAVWTSTLLIGSLAGLLGGWTWWKIEKYLLDRSKLSDTQ